MILSEGGKNPWTLTREDVVAAAKRFGNRPTRGKVLWTVEIEGQWYPARQIVFEAAGLLPNVPMGTIQITQILEGLGFKIKYAGRQY